MRDDPRARAKLMAMGMLPGVPDLVVVDPEGKLHFLEFKREDGELNPAQQEFQRWTIRAGIPHSVVRSVDEALRVFAHWGCI